MARRRKPAEDEADEMPAKGAVPPQFAKGRGGRKGKRKGRRKGGRY